MRFSIESAINQFPILYKKTWLIIIDVLLFKFKVISKMKILLSNYRYFISGGPERYMFSVAKLLEQKGHEVIPFSVNYRGTVETPWLRYFVQPIGGDNEVYFREHSWNIKTLYNAFERAFYSKEVYQSLKRLIKEVRPDAALVLHYLRKLSPSVLVAIKEAGLPLVVRLSDFAMLCPGSLFLRNNETCELCKHGRLWNSIRYRCVQESLCASVVNALATMYHRYKGYFELIDAFIAPTMFIKEKMIEGGWPEDKIQHIPTFVNLDQFRLNVGRKQQIISYTGRIDKAKGLYVLINAFRVIQSKVEYENLILMIADDDKTAEARKLKNYINEKEISNINFTGQLNEQEVAELLSNSLFSVVPSLCYENMPNAMLESLACGTPVAATNIGCFPEIMSENDIGMVFKVGNADDLADKMISLLSNPTRLESMRKSARRIAEQEYNSELHYQRLMNMFEKVMQ